MYEFKQLADNVYVFVQPALIWHNSVGVIVTDRDVVVIDSVANASMARTLIAEISKITDKMVSLLINTHAHADHVYTNHLFAPAPVICSARGLEKTRLFHAQQNRYTETFSKLFPHMDFSGGRYSLQDMSFSGSVTLYHNEREIRVIELGPGHSESDVVVHATGKGIVFCGDLFLNGLPPLPAEGHLTETLSNMKKLEELDAHTYVAGHGKPGTKADVAAQRVLLENLAGHARTCFDKGLTYDEAIAAYDGGTFPIEYAKPAILSGYCEWAGGTPVSRNPADTDHLQVLSSVARRAELLLKK